MVLEKKKKKGEVFKLGIFKMHWEGGKRRGRKEEKKGRESQRSSKALLGRSFFQVWILDHLLSIIFQTVFYWSWDICLLIWDVGSRGYTLFIDL